MARRREWRAPKRCGHRCELTGDQSDGGRATDDVGDEEKAAATFGLTTATAFRRSTVTEKVRTETATRRRSRRWPSRVVTTTGATAATAAQGLTRRRRYIRRRAKTRVATGRGELGGQFIGARERRRRPTATGDGKESLGAAATCSTPPPSPAILHPRRAAASAVAAACRRRHLVRQGVGKPGRTSPFAAGRRSSPSPVIPSRRRRPFVAGRPDHPISGEVAILVRPLMMSS
uniref:Uncharacterized protein n=1 Tax=Oryza sativa subsp. japonica TaxID=39947 RepID=Q6YTM8_ORYSJ|nr:hypothetical protein [Oryza sativa Japonica Group]